MVLMAGYGPLVADLVRKIVALEQMPPNTLLNINLPGIPVDEVQGIRVVPLGSRFYSNSVMKQQDPWGRDVFWIGGGTITWTGETDTDHAVVRDGYVSVTPLQLDITNHALLDTVRDWALRLEE
jgi:5'-nucleotidase